jgi:CBS domain-containing protein
MSILDQRKLIESIHPFELLDSTTLDNLMHKIDIAYYPKDTLLISKTLPSIAFYIIIKGSVSEFVDDEIHNVYGQGDCFDADALIYSKTESKFTVAEDLICYEIKKEDFLDLMQDKNVQNYFLQDFITRHQHLKEYYIESELTPFLISKVSDIYLHAACVVTPEVSIYDALVKMKELKASVIVVKADTIEASMIVTDTDLKDKVLLGGVDVKEEISKITSRNIITIDIKDFLFNALLLMTHKGIKRVIVTQGNEIIGVLEQLDLLSFFANHSHLVTVQIDKAKTISDLKTVQDSLKNIIITLNSKGVKLRYITKLISTLNIKIYEKVFNLFVAESLRSKCSLIVMGSEGREEQAIKTDQDNALIIEDGVDIKLFEEEMYNVNVALLELGFPKCNGNIMVSNPFWRKSVKDYKINIETWVDSLDEEDLKNLSIFLDAKCVAGNCDFFDEVKDYLYATFENRDDVLAHMAKTILYFETPISLFSGFVTDKSHENRLDLKKGGIFAIVHGIRCLSLQYKINATNTIERIKGLNNAGLIDKNFATELIESFDTLTTVRLKAMLESKNIDDTNYINPHSLDKTTRDLLKDSFKVVNRFKKFIRFHFHLEMVS